MTDEGADRTAMICQLFGECQCRAHQPRHPLAERVLEAFTVSGQPGFLRDRSMTVRWHHALRDPILVRRERRLLTIQSWEVCPALPCTLATAIANVKGNDWTGGG